MSTGDAGGATCQRCGQALVDEETLALHVGRVHGPEMDEPERAAFDEARQAEEAWLARFRSHLVASLAAAAIVGTYLAVVLSSYVLRANPVFVAMPSPGIAIFAAVTYWLVYRHRRSVEARDA